ncbi:hypothetical protein RUM44_004950 [Polyplax serrata]|uniref:Tudor domain-containing protein n=1 Tax=Polyplax serrata TaxID=468196 RepID=A0ABR1AWH7_POLSC
MEKMSEKLIEEEVNDIITIEDLKKETKKLPINVSIWDLPPGITPVGIKNLFLCIGKPISIKHFSHKNNAIVEFESLNQAELAVRDLNRKPPYYLKVSLHTSKSSPNLFEAFHPQNENALDQEIMKERFVKEEILLEDCKVNCNTIKETPAHIKALFDSINYDASYQIHKINCDFRVRGSNSVSCGRGYYYSGEDNSFVGGLKKYSIATENSQDDYFCENCNSPTIKYCSTCSASYCSKLCLESLQHKNSNCFSGLNKDTPNTSLLEEIKEVLLTSPCTVVMTSFLTLKNVYVSLANDTWNEKHCRMCNDIMAAIATGETFQNSVEVGEICAAKFYDDSCYYRAEISSIEGENVDVFFMDYGNFQKTEIEDLRPLPEVLKRVPKFAVEVNLTDIPNGTSLDAIAYYNKLTSSSIPLILKFEESYLKGVTLFEKESGDCVNEKVKNHILPSWKKDPSVLSKIGEVFYADSIPNQALKVGQVCRVMVSFIDKNEFDSRGIFWVVQPDTINYNYVKGELRARILEYCEFLKNDFYLPREFELCLAEDNGEWHRCLNIESEKTTCCLTFIDHGKTANIETGKIRKMIADFLVGPQQAIRCVLSDELKMKINSASQDSVFEFLQNKVTEALPCSVLVKEFKNDNYHLEIPMLDNIISNGIVN